MFDVKDCTFYINIFIHIQIFCIDKRYVIPGG